ncbi:hypothetical protein EJ04DRAFT_576537 [Polyplosphaeria fusca]|uniref:HD/PDEase domain-containing protein n=1 Tax=Polyplosphaeria fusca TaxID=682080 RepID=A0A9P4V3B0_9PLEO|nr:hypothetical protein EJ04DRAFT_576537 [Polyplosphaeria fusca]
MCPPSSFPPSATTPQQPPTPIPTSFIPQTPISQAAYNLASTTLPPPILNHSIRVYLYASHLARHSSSPYASGLPQDLLFTACLLHDIGATPRYNGSQRFEVEGADAAAALLRQHDVIEDDVHAVWIAIAIHTSPHIAERISEVAKLVRLAVLFDFGREDGYRDAIGDEDLGELRKGFEGGHERLGIETVLGDAVVKQAVDRPQKAPAASWPNNLYKAYLAEPWWEGVNKGF